MNGSPGELSVDELGKRIVGMSGRIAAATCRWSLLVADFDAREGYLSFGLASSAQWLTHSCGIAHRTTVEQVRVARSLRQHPRLVDDLIEVAQHGTVAQLELMVRGLRTVDHIDNATDPGEYLKQSWTADSRWQLTARLDLSAVQ